MIDQLKEILRPWYMRAWLAVVTILAVAALCGADEYLAIPA